MKVGLVAVHYPRREHWDEMIARVHRAADVLAATPGCLAVVGAVLGPLHSGIGLVRPLPATPSKVLPSPGPYRRPSTLSSDRFSNTTTTT